MTATPVGLPDGGLGPGPDAQEVGFFLGDARVFIESLGCSLRLTSPYGTLLPGPERPLYFPSPDCSGPGVVDASDLDPQSLHECRLGVVRVGGTLGIRVLRPSRPIFFAQAQPFQSVSTRPGGTPVCTSTSTGPVGLYMEQVSAELPDINIDNGTVWYQVR